VPARSAEDLIALVGDRGILGAGGAGFPTHRKLESMAGERVPVVIVNGAEGESASGKDGALLGHVPHLVLDGALAVARALGAPRVVVRISADRLDLVAALESAFAERTDGIRLELSVGPATFVAGEASAVIRAVSGGPALPADLGRPPRTPRRLGRRREHVLLSNAETFARVAVAARGAQAASALASASGAVRTPGVVELPEEATVADLAARAGGLVGAPQVLITGGWHGRWVGWDQQVADTALTRDAVAGVGGRWGAGAFVWVPEDLAPGDALVAVADELAAGTAGQCGPCWRGLPAVAERLARMADAPRHGDPDVAGDLARLLDQVDGRGICAHPTAAVAALRSALDLIGPAA
jgi:NADH:ubiquinone oxidoreductase subunit F (NADH-binding)